MSVDLRYDGEVLFRKDADNRRPPASVQKLLLTMALFDWSGGAPIETLIAGRKRTASVIPGNLWILGRGDPSISTLRGTSKGRFPTPLGRFVRTIRRAGITRIRGSVAAAKTYFKRDWDARGWRADYQEEEVALPTALTIDGNLVDGVPTRVPEAIFATKLTKRLREAGVVVGGRPFAGRPPPDLHPVRTVESARLWVIARGMNKVSNNFFAEVLGKRLGALRYGPRGSIRKGARAIEAFARSNGVRLEAYDSSGLSFANRVSPRGVVSLLRFARRQPWWRAVRRGLASGGEGTLLGRLEDVALRAKTGTLDGVSALAGWVWLERANGWGEFAILSRGLSKDRAVEVEDKLVRIASERARP